MVQFQLGSASTLIVEQGDLTRARVDAIVNAANERMLGGGGVDGAIHRAAGPQLLAACRDLAEVRPNVRCPTGEARITPGFDLPSTYVIHTVGPLYCTAAASAPALASAYRSSLELANARGLKSIAFPAISCGAYGYPVEEAAGVALPTCQAHVGRVSEVRIVLFDGAAFETWAATARDLLSATST